MYAPLPSPFAEFDDLWNRMVSRLFAPIEERERVGVVRHRARRSGSFEYRASLPAGIDAGNIDARFDNGLLTVRVPRPERSKAHRIKIN